MLQIPWIHKDLPAFLEMIRKVEVPGLCIDQEADEPVGQSPPDLLAAAMQDAQGFAVPASNHQVHQDQPVAVNTLMLTFLRTELCHTKAKSAVK